MRNNVVLSRELLDSPEFNFYLFLVVAIVFLPILIDTIRLLVQLRKRGLEHLMILADDGFSQYSLADSGLSGFFLSLSILLVSLGILAFMFPNELSAPAAASLGIFGSFAAVIRQGLRETLRRAVTIPTTHSTVSMSVIEGEIINDPKNSSCFPTNKKTIRQIL